MTQQMGDMRFNCHNMTTDWAWSPLRIRTLPLRNKDVIILVSYNDKIWKACGIPLISLKDVFAISDEEYQSYTWDMPYHCNEKMNERFAKLIKKELEKNYTEEKREKNERRINNNLLYDYKVDISQLILQNNKNLQQWYGKYAGIVKKGLNGAIVMNCNPFTYGHKYLIEYAAERVEHLYIFVVEEDRSYYSFEDRFMMVEHNCKTMKNVSVLSSGKFMISVSTLSGYFDKDSLQDRNIFDALYDLELFGSVISKLFHIVYRFVGEEPTDGYTNNYNKQMKTLLPNYGIEVVEVPRLQIEGRIVSGSYCRRLYEQKKWDVLEKYLSRETMNVLRKDGQ